MNFIDLFFLFHEFLESIHKIVIKTLDQQYFENIFIMSMFASNLLPKMKQQYTFSTFLKAIQEQLQSNKCIYNNFLNTSIIFSILDEFTKLYIDHNSAVQILKIVLDFMAYCKNRSGCVPKLETTFTANYQRELSQQWLKIRQPTYFFNKNQLKLMKYIAKPPQRRCSEQIKNFHTFRFNLDIEQARRVAEDVKKMCNIDVRAFAYLSNYLYTSCINLQKFGLSIPQIRAKYEDLLIQLSVDNPPAPPIKSQPKKLKFHQSFKNTDLIPNISVDLRKYENEQEKEFALQTFIINRAHQSINELQKFNLIIKEICERNEGFRYKSGVKIKHRNQQKAMTRIKEKILSNIYKQIQLKKGLSTSIKDPSLQNFIDIYSFTTQQYTQYQQKIKKIFSTISQPIPFKVSDLLRGKCVFSSVQKINECCSDIKNEIAKREAEGIRLIQVDNRLQKENSDLVMKILFGSTIAELQLVIDLNTAEYEFSHKLYELQRSKFFSPLTQLSILNEDLSKDYFLQVKALILANNLKKAHNYEQRITYEDPLKSFKAFSHRLEVRINFLDAHPNEIDIEMMKNEIRLFEMIQRSKIEKLRQNLSKYEISLNNGIYHYGIKEFSKGLEFLSKAAQQFSKQHLNIVENVQKGRKIDKQTEILLDKYLQILLYQGISYKQLGKYQQALQAFEQQLLIQTNIKKDNSIAKTLRNIGDIFNFLGNKSRALEYFQRSLQIQRKINGQDSFDSAITLRYIGKVYKKQGKLSEALLNFKKSLEIQQKERGKGSIETAITLNYIGNIYNEQQDYECALIIFDKSLEIQQKYKGKGSIDTAITLSNIGNTHAKMNNYEKALQQYFKSLEIQQKVKGKQCLDAAMTLSKIANVYDHLGQYRKALEYYKKSTRVRDKSQVKFQSYAITLFSMGNLNYRHGNYEGAAQSFEQCLKVYEQLKMKGRVTASAAKLAASLKACSKIDKMAQVIEKYDIKPDNV